MDEQVVAEGPLEAVVPLGVVGHQIQMLALETARLALEEILDDGDKLALEAAQLLLVSPAHNLWLALLALLALL